MHGLAAFLWAFGTSNFGLRPVTTMSSKFTANSGKRHCKGYNFHTEQREASSKARVSLVTKSNTVKNEETTPGPWARETVAVLRSSGKS